MKLPLLASLFLGCAFCLLTAPVVAASPEETVLAAKACLDEALANPSSRIPEKMLRDAHAVAIIPNVIKIGFIGGVRRGHGVVLVRDKDGEWGLPQFITITGGSIGWQIGAQSSDVVLVFKSQRSVDNLLKGKFTLGADAAAAAGPVGRRVEAATDLQLKAEILSYARSRGLFAGVSLDGSAIEMDGFAHQTFYGSPATELPRQIPVAATNLVADIAAVTTGKEMAAEGQAAVQVVQTPVDVKKLQGQLISAAAQLAPLLDQRWRDYLTLPAEANDLKSQQLPNVNALNAALANYDTVARTAAYANLSQRPEFQLTHEVLREYTAAVANAGRAQITLPPPPTTVYPPINRQ